MLVEFWVLVVVSMLRDVGYRRYARHMCTVETFVAHHHEGCKIGTWLRYGLGEDPAPPRGNHLSLS